MECPIRADLLTWVKKRYRHSNRAKIIWRQGSAGGAVCGVASKYHRWGYPSSINMTIPKNLFKSFYPCVTQRYSNMPVITYTSSEEEILFVLAHEFRHIDQFWARKSMTYRAAEEDAENFAIGVLEDYREALV